MSEEELDKNVRRICVEGAPARSEPAATLVVGFDHRDKSHTALKFAIDLAARLHARLEVIHAINLADYPIDPDRSDWEEQARLTIAEERADAAAVLRGHSTGWSYHAGREDPAGLLLAVADDRDALMIVVGSRGEGWRRSLDRLLTPSVSHRLVGRGRRPVLVVPTALSSESGTA